MVSPFCSSIGAGILEENGSLALLSTSYTCDKGWQECCIEEAVVGVAVTQLATTTAAGRRDRCGRVRKQHVGFLQSNSWERRTAAAKKKGTQKRKNVSARRIDEKKR